MKQLPTTEANEKDNSDPPPAKKRKAALDILLGDASEELTPSGLAEVEEVTQYFHKKGYPKVI